MLKNICEKEGIAYEELVLKELASKSNGDFRSALTDLETLSQDKKLFSLDGLGEREREGEIQTALYRVMKGKKISAVLNSFNDANVSHDEAALWLDENLAKEYINKSDLNEAYRSMSLADVFNGRIKRRQYWRFLVYRNFFLTAGVALSKSQDYLSYSSYKRSGRLLKLFWAKQKNMKKISIAERFSEKMHCSKKRFIKEIFPFIKLIYKSGKMLNVDLTKDEIDYLTK